MNSNEDYNQLQIIANNDVNVLEEKGKAYGDSWKKRGGVGAYMMLARKFDRLENLAEHYDYNIFKAVVENPGSDGPLDDIRDLRRYLLLVEGEVLRKLEAASKNIGKGLATGAEPGSSYTNQG